MDVLQVAVDGGDHVGGIGLRFTVDLAVIGIKGKLLLSNDTMSKWD